MRIIDADNFLEKLKHAALDSVPINVERDFRLAMRIIENTIDSQPEVNQWISCSEVLPKERIPLEDAQIQFRYVDMMRKRTIVG